jgi:hypothetical protein
LTEEDGGLLDVDGYERGEREQAFDESPRRCPIGKRSAALRRPQRSIHDERNAAMEREHGGERCDVGARPHRSDLDGAHALVSEDFGHLRSDARGGLGVHGAQTRGRLNGGQRADRTSEAPRCSKGA